MSACGRESHIACTRIKSSFIEAVGRGLRARHQQTKSHMCSIGNNPANKQAKEGYMCLVTRKPRTVFATCGLAFSS
ncbi:hypothetical protein TNCV_4774411 [Trichonephila clavipes]|nr:hypothetical protein TNCV_4774411 [Trichonephila clavipes]